MSQERNLENGTHVVKFFATWCGPCKMYAPVFERVAARHPDLDFSEVDIDQEPEIRDQYEVAAVPTTLIVKDGEVVGRRPGATSTHGLDTWLTAVLDS